MGLTINYSYGAMFRRHAEAIKTLEEMRSLAAELPFSLVESLQPIPSREITARRLAQNLNEPGSFAVVNPVYGHAFTIHVGPGCERLDLGFARYPRFIHIGRCRMPTGLTGWNWQGSCKTQYASNPEYGGIRNFLRCHVSVVTLLERIEERIGLCLNVQDEGKWGRSCYSDDWREARAAGRRPTYVWHEARHDLVALAKEVGEWNETVAAVVGELNDVLGEAVRGVSPIRDFPDYEHLEARGRLRRGEDGAATE